MPEKLKHLEEALVDLDSAVRHAVRFFRSADEALFDGHQSARDVLSHLVYWHRVYYRVARALIEGREPPLPRGTFAELNARATARYAKASMDRLSRQLLRRQRHLVNVLRQLPDESLDFPVKQGARRRAVVARIKGIGAHIEGHVARLERARRHGPAWVQAYYPSEAAWTETPIAAAIS